jgi:hypothetical protein
MMRNIGIALLTLLVASATAATREYDVDVYKNFNGWVLGSNGVTESFTNTADSLLWAEFFVGAANDSGSYEFDIKDGPDGSIIYKGLASAGPSYQYVRTNLARQTNNPLIKGKEYVLKVTLQSLNPYDSFNWYADTTNPYAYGMMSVPGNTQPLYWDLAARVEGIVYNNPEMVSTWDMIPAHMVDTFATHRDVEKDSAKTAIQNGADMMATLGIKSNRIVDLWRQVQPYPDSQNVFKWDTVDFCWRTLASHGIHPHLVAQGGGPWRLDDSVWHDWDHGRQGNFWPTNMFQPVKVNGEINPNNHLAWFYYNYAKRYGPGGTFWQEYADAPYLPLLYVELCNEPTYLWRSKNWRNSNVVWDQWWQGDDGSVAGRIRDTTVIRIRNDNNWGDPGEWDLPGRLTSFEIVYSRYCAVLDSAVKSASDSIRTEIYCPGSDEASPPDHPENGSGVPTGDWLDAIYNNGGGQVCDMVSFHSHRDPAEFENSAVDVIYDTLSKHNFGDKLIAVGEGSMPWVPGGNPEDPLGANWWAKLLTETFATFWARNADPKRPIAYFDWQSSSSWFVPDGLGYDGSYAPNGGYHWGITDDAFEDRNASCALAQVTAKLAGKQFCRRLDRLPGADTNVAILEFQNVESGDSSRLWVAWDKWRSSCTTGIARIPLRTSSAETTTIALSTTQPNGRSIQAATDGYAECTVGRSPVFIEEAAVSQISRPDLAVESVWTTFMPSPSCPQPRRFWAKIHNVGNAWSPQQGYSSTMGGPVNFYANGQLVAHASSLAGIQNGEALYAVSDGVWQPDDPGEYLVKAVVNEQQKFVELNWDNNAKYRVIQMQPIYAQEYEPSGGRTLVRSQGAGAIQSVAGFVEVG